MVLRQNIKTATYNLLGGGEGGSKYKIDLEGLITDWMDWVFLFSNFWVLALGWNWIEGSEKIDKYFKIENHA